MHYRQSPYLYSHLYRSSPHLYELSPHTVRIISTILLPGASTQLSLNQYFRNIINLQIVMHLSKQPRYPNYNLVPFVFRQVILLNFGDSFSTSSMNHLHITLQQFFQQEERGFRCCFRQLLICCVRLSLPWKIMLHWLHSYGFYPV